MWDLGTSLGFDTDHTHKIVDYLIGEYLIQAKGLGGFIGITHEGIKMVEESAKPQKPILKEPQVNILNVNKMINSNIQQSTQDSQQVYVNTLDENKKKGYVAGVVSLLICVIFAAMVFNLGWDLTGQILTAFSSLFGILGVGSLIKPESVGQVTAQILHNIGKNYEEPKKKR